MIITQPKELIGAFVNVQQGYSAETPWGNFNALGLVVADRLVAGVIYNGYEAANVNMHIGAIEGSHWLTPSFLFAAFDYPFNELNKRRASAYIKAKNKRAIQFARNLGFKYEGTLKNFYKDDDQLVYGMLREHCRFLEIRKAA